MGGGAAELKVGGLAATEAGEGCAGEGAVAETGAGVESGPG
jgi:hypothetical protein